MDFIPENTLSVQIHLNTLLFKMVHSQVSVCFCVCFLSSGMALDGPGAVSVSGERGTMKSDTESTVHACFSTQTLLHLLCCSNTANSVFALAIL